MLFPLAFNSTLRRLLTDRSGQRAAFRAGGGGFPPARTWALSCGPLLEGRLLPLIVLSLAPAFVYGQPDPVVELLPAWPRSAGAKIIADQYVFRDPSGEIVVSYPDPSDPKRNVTFRFWLHNRVDPQILVSIKRRSDVKFAYDYTLRNGRLPKLGSGPGPSLDPRPTNQSSRASAGMG